MADEFPDPDEEFDHIHEEDYEVLRELEAELPGERLLSQPVSFKKICKTANAEKSIASNDVSQTIDGLSGERLLSQPVSFKKISNTNTNTKKYVANNDISQTTDLGEIDNAMPSTSRKRSYDELFGDITDLLETDVLADFDEPQEKKIRWNQPEDAIKKILDARKLIYQHTENTSVERKYDEKYKNSISLRVPSWNFIAVTRSYDSQRLYVRVRNIRSDVKPSKKPIANLLSVPYAQLKSQAEKIITKRNKLMEQSLSDSSTVNNIINDELWIDKYRPRSYLELLSDESVNREFLYWLKLWDKIVFNREIKQKKKQLPKFGKNKVVNGNNIEEVDSKGYPIKRIALLSGPPGLGKTTLAHIAAKHAGYNVVEINASDERSPDTFRQILLASTEMKAVMGANPRPNCLIFDEIDGAPTASIELLLKFVQGKLVPKSKKAKKLSEKAHDGCIRPIVCICNEPYAPSLRTLRAAAVIIPVTEVSSLRLAERLMQISKKEKLNTDFGDLVQLAEKSGCDVRSCIGALQYMGNAGFKDNLSLGLKDTRKNLFDSWQSIFMIPINKRGIVNIPERVDNILKTVQNGETEKLIQGIFHNYPEIYDHKLNNVSTSLEWFQFYDIITSIVMHKQVWSLMPYRNYGFIAWHLHLARKQKPKLSFPSVVNEVTQKSAKNTGILTAIRRVCGRDIFILATEIASFLPDLLTARLRTVPSHLYSSKEKADLVRIVNIMLEFGLSFVQEKGSQGGYIYNLDPNIIEIGIFPGCMSHRCLTYALQQIIAQELEVERLRRASILTGLGRDNVHDAKSSKDSKIVQCTQNKSSNKPNNIKPSEKNVTSLKKVIYKDFFGNIITSKTEDHQNQSEEKNHISSKSQKRNTAMQNILTKHGIWYKYKEGCNNAVRRNVSIEKLL